ncbi:hypothetical protein [Noviherbaspirillum sp. Root189]|uniref:hypothetical protein n=1 Tax=Noviherbaspirillum sp. Root189 TaxID=1736487 RepID=UPI00070AD113|nr:hypothetical protein [Noviherbaspirillum sp. Root189]KRB94103.1 hypothetical protein ASE07_00760 [Noviherbaspirillum sp. Root189]
MNIDKLRLLADEETNDAKARRQRRKRNEVFRHKLVKQRALQSQHRYLMLSIGAAVITWTFAGIQVLR